MNPDRFFGMWKQLRGLAKEQWGLLTENALAVAAGQREQFDGQILARRGLAQQEADRQLAEFMHRNRNWRSPSESERKVRREFHPRAQAQDSAFTRSGTRRPSAHA